jgi:hypothetical protein
MSQVQGAVMNDSYLTTKSSYIENSGLLSKVWFMSATIVVPAIGVVGGNGGEALY